MIQRCSNIVVPLLSLGNCGTVSEVIPSLSGRFRCWRSGQSAWTKPGLLESHRIRLWISLMRIADQLDDIRPEFETQRTCETDQVTAAVTASTNHLDSSFAARTIVCMGDSVGERTTCTKNCDPRSYIHIPLAFTWRLRAR